MSRGLLNVWRRQARELAMAPEEMFAAVRIESNADQSDGAVATAVPKDKPPVTAASTIEVEIGDATIRVPLGVDLETLERGHHGAAWGAMISFGSDTRVFVSTQPVDFRKGVHGLVALVAEGLKGNPYCGDIFVFRSKRKDRLKILVFDGTGMILATKWLEEGGFAWPPIKEGCMCVSATQLAMLVEGLSEWSRVVPKLVKRPMKTA